MTQHTPGPWNVMPSKKSGLLHIETDLTSPVAGVPICSVSGNAANARLIAQAPILYALVRAHLLAYPDDAYTARIEAVIKKIEG